ncbi:hypothetical protein LNO81_21740 [Klebsiella variicola subsp. variicola]|nr:hypothetical protein [Klebsiella variicola subsp. variicola]
MNSPFAVPADVQLAHFLPPSDEGREICPAVPPARTIASASPATISVNRWTLYIPPIMPSRWFSHA